MDLSLHKVTKNCIFTLTKINVGRMNSVAFCQLNFPIKKTISFVKRSNL